MAIDIDIDIGIETLAPTELKVSFSVRALARFPFHAKSGNNRSSRKKTFKYNRKNTCGIFYYFLWFRSMFGESVGNAKNLENVEPRAPA